MKLGILISNTSNINDRNYYNVQEIGLAKGLSEFFEKIFIFKLVKTITEIEYQVIQQNISIVYIKANRIGDNGIFNPKKLNMDIDILIHSADTQLCVPYIFKWAQKNKIRYIPYIGVTRSHSESRFKAAIINTHFKRNIEVYKKCKCMVKTTGVYRKLLNDGVNNMCILPVGLNQELLNNDYRSVESFYLKKLLGYSKNDKIILFVGRMVEEKRPLDLIDLFECIVKRDSSYCLIMIGDGKQRLTVIDKIREKKLEKKVRVIERVLNKDIWRFYRASDAVVNLNKNEIFGMTILEAMFYECKVIAWRAPGPEFIIENQKSGFIVDSFDEIKEVLFCNKSNVGLEAHNRILRKFTWNCIAEDVHRYITEVHDER